MFFPQSHTGLQRLSWRSRGSICQVHPLQCTEAIYNDFIHLLSISLPSRQCMLVDVVRDNDNDMPIAPPGARATQLNLDGTRLAYSHVGTAGVISEAPAVLLGLWLLTLAVPLALPPELGTWRIKSYNTGSVGRMSSIIRLLIWEAQVRQHTPRDSSAHGDVALTST
ncbi:hypothetical protein OE88DRAFT_1564184 [Heliocybe sulcata]|uniref:Uncharacterized protein n=1 Tax=Heliocybe sulcata TaxID=5364 RepID=A0A5C3NCI9_9AGAM|nr:hypothetical protein OE88DRAFT_1564184 [Heliocybe sulcata]